MVAQVVARALARKVFRDKRGRFISKAKHQLNQRRSLISGRFTTQKIADAERAKEAAFIKRLGKAPAGTKWVAVADKYEPRFAGLNREINQSIR